jgi:hypothetical protein
MQVFANIPVKTMSRVRGRRQNNSYGGWFTAVRLIGPERQSHDKYARGHFICVDVLVPDDVREFALGPFQPDGTLRVQVWTASHLKTLRPFLASGDLEWDVRERE